MTHEHVWSGYIQHHTSLCVPTRTTLTTNHDPTNTPCVRTPPRRPRRGRPRARPIRLSRTHAAFDSRQRTQPTMAYVIDFDAMRCVRTARRGAPARCDVDRARGAAMRTAVDRGSRAYDVARAQGVGDGRGRAMGGARWVGRGCMREGCVRWIRADLGRGWRREGGERARHGDGFGVLPGARARARRARELLRVYSVLTCACVCVDVCCKQ